MEKITEGLPELYQYYLDQGGTYSKKEFRKIMKHYYKKVIDRILIDAHWYKLGQVCHIHTVKKKSEVRLDDNGNVKVYHAVDFKASKELGKLVYHENKHVDGYIFRIKCKFDNIKGMSLFKFRPERYDFKRYYARLIFNPDIKIDAPLL